MTHFTAEEWIDFANESVAKSSRQEMERHLEEGCPRCKKAASLWQKVRQTAKSAVDCQPPEDEVRIAKAGFTDNRLYGKRAKAPGLAELLFDSFLQPLTAGARSSRSGIRQMLYRAEPYQVDLHIEAKPGANKLIVTGQLLDLRNPDLPGRDVPVVISNLRGEVVHALTNEFGEFRQEIRSSSDLELKFVGEEQEAVIISVRDPLGELPDTAN
jgi:phage FluMu protein Com